MSDNQQQRFQVKLFKGTQNKVTKAVNRCLSQKKEEKLLLKDTQFLLQGNQAVVLLLFEANHLKLHFSHTKQPTVCFVSEQQVAYLENQLNAELKEKQKDNYYPTHIRLQTNNLSKIFAFVVFEHSNLLQDFA